MGKSFENLVRDIQSKLHVLFIKKSESNPGRLAMVEATKIPWYKNGCYFDSFNYEY
jgi:hypothetical protein